MQIFNNLLVLVLWLLLIRLCGCSNF